MSVQASTYVWEHSAQKGTNLLLLLAIANIADREGVAYPGVKRLAKDIRMSQRNTQRALKRLEESGELSIQGNAGPHGCHLYQINIRGTLPLFSASAGDDKLSCVKLTPDTGGRKGMTSGALGDDTVMSPEPSVNQKRTKEGGVAARATRLSPDWQLPKALGDWALNEQPTWTADHVRRVAENFRDHWIAVPGRHGTKLDWPATWRKWVRGEGAMKGGKNGASAKPWFRSASGITEKGRSRGFDVPADASGWEAFKTKVYEAEGVTPAMLRAAEVDFA